ncbi:DUF4139 domain-containing protein [Thermoflavimicrobium daqui]|uniref:DUF4139 domain-containing protein n=1 Tax=Thermoflavimicrobium daqui TaxID=2137476 RepID=A0A364K5S0_9BACL|nr:DUF4139 domain-containing protein [Thermoflavimicrobium daqui]RAL25562.1 DUF4139 domain-containing protein [Thermoflavimicrobium daqui]
MAYISTKDDTKQLSLTIYNDGFGVVKETRIMNLDDQEQEVYYLDVAEKTEIDSILINGLQVQEMNYEYDLVSKKKLLEKYIDQTIYIFDKETKTKTEYRLLSVTDGIVVENTTTKEIIINPYGEMVLPQLPTGLIVKPGLVWKVKQAYQENIHISYITRGFSWEANYVIHLKEEKFDLSGWVHIWNETGATYENAELKLIAGEIHRSMEHSDMEEVLLYSALDEDSNSNFKEQSFHDFHLYTCKEKTTLKNNQSKQVQFLHYTHIPYKKYYENAAYYSYESSKEIPVSVHIEWNNNKESQLGVPLPKGKIKVYSKDEADQNLEFIGEDQINHTSHGEKVKLLLGKAFDVKMQSRVIDKYTKWGYQYYTQEYKIQNKTHEKILFKLKHDLYFLREEWLTSTHPFEMIDQNSYVCWLEIEPETEETIQVKYREKAK